MSSYQDRVDFDWKRFTWERLRWAHGDDRARQIAMGNDTATKRDVEAWRLLGRRRVA